MSGSFVRSTGIVWADFGANLGLSLTSVPAGRKVVAVAFGSWFTAPGHQFPNPGTGWVQCTNPPSIGTMGGFSVSVTAWEKQSAGGTETANFNSNPSTSFLGGFIVECDGLDTGVALDIVGTNSTTGGTTLTVTATPTVGGGIAFALCHPEDGSGATAALINPTGWTQIQREATNSAHIALVGSYQLYAGTSALSATWTWTATSMAYGAIITLKPAAGAGGDVTLTPSGFNPTMSLGTPSVVRVSNPTVTPAGFGLTMSLGTPVVSAGVTRVVTGFGLTMSVGAPTVQVVSNPTVAPAGFGLTMSLGSPSLTYDSKVTPVGFGLTMNLGTASTTTGSNPTLTPSGFGLTMALGTPSVRGDTVQLPTSLSAPFTLGSPSLSILNNVGDKNVNPIGLSTTMNLGVPSLRLSQVLTPSGFPLLMQLGTPSIIGPVGASGQDIHNLGIGFRIGVR